VEAIRTEALTAEALAAREAALRYIDDSVPGIRRSRRGSAFSYTDPGGKVIRDRQVLARIRALAVPPAYQDVWICPHTNGHLQATGRDARGRKQYRYHRRWREVRDEAKYKRAIEFARSLPALRARIARDLAATDLSKPTVVAAVVRLLDTTLARIGNETYARDNGSFGLTTLRTRHVRPARGGLRLRFRGKSGVEHEIDIADRRLAAVIRRCHDLPGQLLFNYVAADGAVVPVTSDDVNEYVRETAGAEFTAKDFRTWHGTVLCALELAATAAAGSGARTPARRVVGGQGGRIAPAQHGRRLPDELRASGGDRSLLDGRQARASARRPRQRRRTRGIRRRRAARTAVPRTRVAA